MAWLVYCLTRLNYAMNSKKEQREMTQILTDLATQCTFQSYTLLFFCLDC